MGLRIKDSLIKVHDNLQWLKNFFYVELLNEQKLYCTSEISLPVFARRHFMGLHHFLLLKCTTWKYEIYQSAFNYIIRYLFHTHETKCKDKIMTCFHIIRFTQLCNIMSQIPNVWGKAESVKLCNAWMKYHLYTIIQQQNHRNAS